MKTVKSGTSYATSVAAGLAGSLLEYARLKMNLGEDGIDLLRRYKGMRAVYSTNAPSSPGDLKLVLLLYCNER